jgi:hypothetical protein
MRIAYGIFFIAFILVLCCCTGPNSQGTAAEAAMAEDSAALREPLYPFAQYLAQQIAYVDSTPFAIERITHVDGQLVDSGLTTHDIFTEIAAPLATIDVNSASLRPFYRETSFNDLTLDALTFNIATQKADLPLQEATVLLQPESKAVKNVMLRINRREGDSLVTQRVLWVHNKNFTISRTVDFGNRRYTKTTKIIWDRP